MKNAFDIYEYNEDVLDQLSKKILPIYHLWSVHPLENRALHLESGSRDEIDKFRKFIMKHAGSEYPHPLLIIVGNHEEANQSMMLNRSKKFFKLSFDEYKGYEPDYGSPLILSGMGFKGIPHDPGIDPLRIGRGVGLSAAGLQFGDIQGIIDRNVSDAVRTLRAEYQEQNSKREIEYMKSLADLEMKIRQSNLELKEQNLAEKERRIQEELDAARSELEERLRELEEKQAEGLGNVKEYAKAIGGGLWELGKSFFGIEGKKDAVKDKTQDGTETGKSGEPERKKSIWDRPGFRKVEDPEETEEPEEQSKTVNLSGLSDVKGLKIEENNMGDETKILQVFEALASLSEEDRIRIFATFMEGIPEIDETEPDLPDTDETDTEDPQHEEPEEPEIGFEDDVLEDDEQPENEKDESIIEDFERTVEGSEGVVENEGEGSVYCDDPEETGARDEIPFQDSG